MINTSLLYTIYIHILWNIGLTVEKNVPGGRMTPQEWDNFFYCVISISKNTGKILYTISLYVLIKGQQRSSWSFFFNFHLSKLSIALGEFGQNIEMHLRLLSKFTKGFRQVQQVKVQKKKSWEPLLNVNWYIQVGCLLSIFFFSEILVSP